MDRDRLIRSIMARDGLDYAAASQRVDEIYNSDNYAGQIREYQTFARNNKSLIDDYYRDAIRDTAGQTTMNPTNSGQGSGGWNPFDNQSWEQKYSLAYNNPSSGFGYAESFDPFGILGGGSTSNSAQGQDESNPFSALESPGAGEAGGSGYVDEQGRLVGGSGDYGRDYRRMSFQDPVPLLAKNTDYAAHSFGRALGASKGTPGRGMGIVAGLGDMTLGLGRNFLSGFADSKDSSRVYAQSRREQDRLNQGVYTQNRSQYVDPSGRYKYGALFSEPNRRQRYFEDGGMSGEEAEMMAKMEQQMAQEQGGQPQQGMPQEGQGVDQEVVEMAAQLLEQFGPDIETIGQFLSQEGIEDQVIQVILQVVAEMAQGMEGQQGGQPQEEPMPEAGGSAVMRNTMNRRMDMPMEFRRGGQYPRLPL